MFSAPPRQNSPYYPLPFNFYFPICRQKQRIKLALIKAASILFAATLALIWATSECRSQASTSINQPPLQSLGVTPADYGKLTGFEKSFANKIPNAIIAARRDIVLIYSPDVQVDIPEEAGVTGMNGVADWIQRLYDVMKRLTDYDPNEQYAERNGTRNRLIVLMNNTRNYHTGGTRPWVGSNSNVTGAHWFRYISHEVGHDFNARHPKLFGRMNGWVEGLTEYLSYNALVALNMKQTAANFEEAMAKSYAKNPADRYRGRAYHLLLKQRELGCKDASEFLPLTYGQDINSFMGYLPLPPPKPADTVRSLVADWDFEGPSPLADKASGGTVKDNLTPLGKVAIRDGIATIPGAGKSALRAQNSADLSLKGEFTLWARLRVTGQVLKNTPTVCLIDKSHYKNPEAITYSLCMRRLSNTDQWSVGGFISADGTADMGLNKVSGEAALQNNQWQEVAMVVRGRGDYAQVTWLIADSEEDGEKDFEIVNGPISKRMRWINENSNPLFIGNNSELKDHSPIVEFDEIRIYKAALSPEDLSAITSGRTP